jgi:hypothetical protein
MSIIDEGSFLSAATRQDFLGRSAKKAKRMPASLVLRPYAVARISATG